LKSTYILPINPCVSSARVLKAEETTNKFEKKNTNNQQWNYPSGKSFEPNS
jgi:hypothetical protein